MPAPQPTGMAYNNENRLLHLKIPICRAHFSHRVENTLYLCIVMQIRSGAGTFSRVRTTFRKQRGPHGTDKRTAYTPMKLRAMLIYCLANVGMMCSIQFRHLHSLFLRAEEIRRGGYRARGHTVCAHCPRRTRLFFGRIVDAIANRLSASGATAQKQNGQTHSLCTLRINPMTAFFILMYSPPIHHLSKWNAVGSA